MNEKNPIAILAVKLQQVSSQKNQNSPIELFSAGKNISDLNLNLQPFPYQAAYFN
jgi:hypothetical protein